MNLIPYVVQSTGRGERAMDIYSQLLMNRIVMLTGEINEATSSLIVAQLLYLESQDPSADIYLYINSPGGSVTAGMAIFDTMHHVKCDVSTICVGQACSMGSLLLSSGTKGKRYALPNAEVMIHQPSAGTSGQVTDMGIAYKRFEAVKDRLCRILSSNTGQEFDKIYQDCERDYFLTAEEAKQYGLIDEVLYN